MQLSNFLRIVLKLDSASCLGTGALVLPAAGALQYPLGIDAVLLRAAVAPLIPVGLYMLWLGIRREAAPGLVWLVILGNIGWAAASLVAAADLPGITPLGRLAVAGQGLAVLALATLEWAGLRQSRAAIA
jgi:hypothetical protein